MVEREIIINPKFDFDIIFNANRHILISKSTYIAFGFIYLVMISHFVLSIFDSDNEFNVYSSFLSKPFPYLILLFPILFYFMLRQSSKKSLKNYRLNEDIKFIFNNNFFQEKGQTFDIKHYWNKLLKIKERKKYFLIYQTKRRANIIPKQSFNKEQLNDFRNLINALPIKSNINKQ